MYHRSLLEWRNLQLKLSTPKDELHAKIQILDPVIMTMICIYWMSTDTLSSRSTMHIIEPILRFFAPSFHERDPHDPRHDPEGCPCDRVSHPRDIAVQSVRAGSHEQCLWRWALSSLAVVCCMQSLTSSTIIYPDEDGYSCRCRINVLEEFLLNLSVLSGIVDIRRKRDMSMRRRGLFPSPRHDPFLPVTTTVSPRSLNMIFRNPPSSTSPSSLAVYSCALLRYSRACSRRTARRAPAMHDSRSA